MLPVVAEPPVVPRLGRQGVPLATRCSTLPLWESPHWELPAPNLKDHPVLQETPVMSPEVSAVFSSYDAETQTGLLALRRLVFDTAEETPGVGQLQETLRWQQPSYLTPQTKSGSTIRIAPTGTKSNADYAMYFICHTDLVERFRSLFGDRFHYDGNRALEFSLGAEIPSNELRQCIAMALTYHLGA